jgi:hypothetical protein
VKRPNTRDSKKFKTVKTVKRKPTVGPEQVAGDQEQERNLVKSSRKAYTQRLKV